MARHRRYDRLQVAFRPLAQKEYWKSLQWYNDLLGQHDAQVLGACLYQVGWMSEWRSFRLTRAYADAQGQEQPIRIIDWIAEQLV